MCSSSARNGWVDYIDGHVVSRNAVRLIKTMLLQTTASNQYDKEAEDDAEKDESDVDEETCPLTLSDTDLKTILYGGKAPDENGQTGNGCVRSALGKSMLQ